jgi:7-carboxy-7-deazaguanine synthase
VNGEGQVPRAEPGVLTPALYGAVAPDGDHWPLNIDDRSLYRVAELYPTVQGEGALAGTPMTIVRLQGCPVACVFCDTPHTWDERETAGSFGHGGRYEVPLTAASSVATRAAIHPPTWVLVTGGEPAWHDLDALTSALHAVGKRCALETSGVYQVTGSWDWLTVSPKPAGRLRLHEDALRRATEIKWLVGRESDLDALRALAPTLAAAGKHDEVQPRVCVQPISTNSRATMLCVEFAVRHPWVRVSLQTHKYAGVA